MATALPDPADFLADTAVERSGAGLYRCELSERWNAAVYPMGGVTSALALRAMEAELGHPTQRLRSATMIFVSPVPAGALEIRTEVLREGKRMSQLQATVRAAGSRDGGLKATASFGEAREGFAFTDAEPPDAPPPERCPEPSEPPPDYRRWRAPFFEQVEFRPVRMNPPWSSDWEGGRAEAVRWMRFRRTPRAADGSVDPLALVALSDTMPPAIGQRLGPGYPFFYAPSCDLSVHVFESTPEEWLLVRSRCRHAGEGYASAESEIWDGRGRLIVWGAQLMYIRMGPIEG